MVQENARERIRANAAIDRVIDSVRDKIAHGAFTLESRARQVSI